MFCDHTVNKSLKQKTGKVKLQNNQSLKARNFADTADIELHKLNTSNQWEFLVLPVHSGSNIATEGFVNTGLSAKEDSANKALRRIRDGNG